MAKTSFLCIVINASISVILTALKANAIVFIAYRLVRIKLVASLSVRRIDDETVALLRIRAARHGVSMEEEARQILKRAVEAPERLGDMAVRLFSSAYGHEELALPERETSEPMDFPE